MLLDVNLNQSSFKLFLNQYPPPPPLSQTKHNAFTHFESQIKICPNFNERQVLFGELTKNARMQKKKKSVTTKKINNVVILATVLVQNFKEKL